MNTSSNNDTTGYTLSTTVAKAFDILEYIAEHQPVNPSKITRELKLTRSNVHRLLATLVNKGYVVKDDSGYLLSFKLFQLGNSIPFKRDLRVVAKPLMSRLMEKVNENVYLNALSGEMIIAVDMVKSDNHLTLNAEKVYTYPLNTCASGKVYLSTLSDEALQDTVGRLDMTRMTDFTITDRDRLIYEIKEVRVRGFGTEIMEFSEELNSVAAPVYDYQNQIVGTISLSGPANRLTVQKIEQHVEELKRTAADISSRLGK